MRDLLTVRQAAARLGISGARVRALIAARRLPAVKFGWAWMIRERDLTRVADRRPGRPVTTGAGLRRRRRNNVEPKVWQRSGRAT